MTGVMGTQVQWRDRVQLLTVSPYLSPLSDKISRQSPKVLPSPIGVYDKDKTIRGFLAAVPPCGDMIGPGLFLPSTFTMTRVSGGGWSEPSSGDELREDSATSRGVRYGDELALVDQNGKVWNASYVGLQGPIGPRDRGTHGELFVSFSAKGKRFGDPVLYGDSGLSIVVEDAHLWLRSTPRIALSVHKKATSKTQGGYLYHGADGHPLTFQIVSAGGATASGDPGLFDASPLRPRRQRPSLTTTRFKLRGISVKGSVDERTPKCDRGWGCAVSLGAVSADDVVEVTVGDADSQKAWTVGLQCPPADFYPAPKGSDGFAGYSQIVQMGSSSKGLCTLEMEASWEVPAEESTVAVPVQKVKQLQPGIGLLEGANLNGVLLAGALPIAWALIHWWVYDGSWRSAAVPPALSFVIAIIYFVICGAWDTSSSPLTPIEMKARKRVLTLCLRVDPASIEAMHAAENSEAPRGVPGANISGTPSACANVPGSARVSTLSAQQQASPALEYITLPDGFKVPAAMKGVEPLIKTKQLNGPDDPPQLFVDAEKGNFAKAQTRWAKTLVWRDENNMNDILEQPQINYHFIKKHYPHFYYERTGLLDSAGNGILLYVERPTTEQGTDVSLLQRGGMTVESVLRNMFFCTEFLYTQVLSKETDRTVTIVDFKGFKMSEAWGEGLEFAKRLAQLLGAQFPERAAKVFLINTPRWFNAVWKLVALFVDATTKKKISVFGSGSINKALAELHELCGGPAYLPPEYGGTGPPLSEAPTDNIIKAHVEALNKRNGLVPYEYWDEKAVHPRT